MTKKTTLWARNLWAGSIGTPPAQLSLTADDFVPRFLSLDGAIPFKFNRRDVPYIKGVLLSSNFADGLLPQTEMGLKLSLIRFGKALSGKLGNVAGSADFTMDGGALVSEACPGMVVWWVDDSGVQRSATIETIVDDESGTFSVATKSSASYSDDTTAADALPQIAPAYEDSYAVPLWQQPNCFNRRLGTQVQQPSQGVIRGELSIVAPEDGETESILHGRPLDDSTLSAAFRRDLVAGQVMRLKGRTLFVGEVEGQFRAKITHPDPDVAASPAGIPLAAEFELADRMDDHFRILVEMASSTQNFETISTSVDYAGDTCTIDAQVELCHSYFEVGHAG